MPGSTNFLQWNPNAVNQENDGTYAGDSLRSGGAPLNAICPSGVTNKAWFQWSTFITAMAQMLATKGYSPNDGSANPATSIPNLSAVLANIMTQADMAPFAPKNNPLFTGDPQAPTPAPGDNDQSIATTAFVNAAIAASAAGLAANFAVWSFLPDSPGVYTKAGFIRFPLFGNVMLQWFIGAQDAANEFQVLKNFPTAFPNNCFNVQVTYGNTVSTQANDSWYQVVTFTKTGVTLFKQGTGGTQQVSSPYIFAIGN
jgi:hypothetical protein